MEERNKELDEMRISDTNIIAKNEIFGKIEKFFQDRGVGQGAKTEFIMDNGTLIPDEVLVCWFRTNDKKPYLSDSTTLVFIGFEVGNMSDGIFALYDQQKKMQDKWNTNSIEFDHYAEFDGEEISVLTENAVAYIKKTLHSTAISGINLKHTELCDYDNFVKIWDGWIDRNLKQK